MTRPQARAPAPAFAGFGPRALDFLRALAFHQDRAWFEENRGLYETDVRGPLEALVLALSADFSGLGLPLRGDARSVFRLHRDTRFAKDKRPYKTNAGAVLSPDGTRKAQGFLYLHVDPEGCFAAAGFWRPEPDELAALRRAIRDRPDAFRDVVRSLDASRLALGDGDASSRSPKGFEEVIEPDLSAAVRRRNLLVRRPIPDEALGSAALVPALVGFAQDVEPLLRFGWQALGRTP